MCAIESSSCAVVKRLKRRSIVVVVEELFPSHFPLSVQQIGNNSSSNVRHDRRDREKKKKPPIQQRCLLCRTEQQASLILHLILRHVKWDYIIRTYILSISIYIYTHIYIYICAYIAAIDFLERNNAQTVFEIIRNLLFLKIKIKKKRSKKKFLTTFQYVVQHIMIGMDLYTFHL